MSPLADLRILVVEDEVFIAWEIEQRLQRLGCEVVGPVGHLERALELARTTALDGALLDVNIKGGVVYPVAEELLARKVPVVFSTGYAPRHAAPGVPGSPLPAQALWRGAARDHGTGGIRWTARKNQSRLIVGSASNTNQSIYIIHSIKKLSLVSVR